MLGGGVFVTQNKTLPGSYINVVNAQRASSTISDRGVVALQLYLGISEGSAIEITRDEYFKNPDWYVGSELSDTEREEVHIVLREIFCHANKVYAYDSKTGGTANLAKVFDSLEFNVLVSLSDSANVLSNAVKAWRDEKGKKCQLVVAKSIETGATAPDHEGTVVVGSLLKPTTLLNQAAIAYWVAGALAGCALNESCTNMLYDGELEIIVDKTQAELETCLKKGEFVFHNVYGEVRVLEDVNSLTTLTADKGEDFKYNQTIRVVDQVANDIARMFNTKYLGKIPNNASGRISLWADIVAHHRQLEAIGAIENFDATLVTVEQGDTKRSVVVNDVITVVNTMSQLYMTIVVQ